MIPTFIRAYEAADEIDGYQLVVFADPTVDKSIEPAVGSGAFILGTADAMGSDPRGMCDVHRGGLVSVKLGGTVQAGDPITANTSGLAVVAAPAAGTTAFIVGFADDHGGVGDIIDVFFAPGTIRG